MARLPGGWEDLPNEVRGALERGGLDRTWQGIGGSNPRKMEAELGHAWDDVLAGNTMSWDTATHLQAWGMRPADLNDIAAYRIDSADGHWYGTITFRDGRELRIDFGAQDGSAWDLYDYCDYILDDVEVERGDVEYRE